MGQDTPLPSIQLSIESVDQAGGCAYNYSCVYIDSISWASPKNPLPMVRDPRMVFDMLFGAGSTAEDGLNVLARIEAFWTGSLTKCSGPQEYTAEVRPFASRRISSTTSREIERRIQRIEQRNLSGENRSSADGSVGVPESYAEACWPDVRPAGISLRGRYYPGFFI